jgi:hypothetical protein
VGPLAAFRGGVPFDLAVKLVGLETLHAAAASPSRWNNWKVRGAVPCFVVLSFILQAYAQDDVGYGR